MMWLHDVLQNDNIISETSVIDVGILDSGEFAIIESNPCWASGIYGCDRKAVLNVLKDSVENLN